MLRPPSSARSRATSRGSSRATPRRPAGEASDGGIGPWRLLRLLNEKRASVSGRAKGWAAKSRLRAKEVHGADASQDSTQPGVRESVTRIISREEARLRLARQKLAESDGESNDFLGDRIGGDVVSLPVVPPGTSVCRMGTGLISADLSSREDKGDGISTLSTVSQWLPSAIMPGNLSSLAETSVLQSGWVVPELRGPERPPAPAVRRMSSASPRHSGYRGPGRPQPEGAVPEIGFGRGKVLFSTPGARPPESSGDPDSHLPIPAMTSLGSFHVDALEIPAVERLSGRLSVESELPVLQLDSLPCAYSSVLGSARTNKGRVDDGLPDSGDLAGATDPSTHVGSSLADAFPPDPLAQAALEKRPKGRDRQRRRGRSKAHAVDAIGERSAASTDPERMRSENGP